MLLGATILFKDIMTAGSFGLIQAVIVVAGVWYFAFWISRKMKVDDEFATMLASAVSICGVSAAIATAGAINGDKKEVSIHHFPGAYHRHSNDDIYAYPWQNGWDCQR